MEWNERKKCKQKQKIKSKENINVNQDLKKTNNNNNNSILCIIMKKIGFACDFHGNNGVVGIVDPTDC